MPKKHIYESEIPTVQSVQTVNSLDSLMLGIPLLLSLCGFGVREFVKFQVEKNTAKEALAIEMEKQEQNQKCERIRYLEKQNEMLLNEILSLRRIMEASGPLNLEMYKPEMEKIKVRRSRSVA